jgi:ribosome-associated toxin RatA of RatAB toxin-antitoxin module
MASFSNSIAIKAPREKVFEIVTDFARYPKFIPEVEAVQVITKTKTRAKATFTVNLVKMINYTLDFRITPPDKIGWTLVDGDFMESNDGSWVLTALEKNLTDAAFSVNIGFPFWVPSSLAEGAIKSTMPKMMKHFKTEAEKGALAKSKKTAKARR